MSWVRLDDQFFQHRRVVDLTNAAKLAFLAGLCYCNAQLTDGFISTGAARSLLGGLGYGPKVAKELVDHGFWHKRADGYEVHSYLEYQPTAAQIRAGRDKAKNRMKRVRSGRSSGERSADVRANTHANVGRSSPSPTPTPLLTNSSSSELLSRGNHEEEEEMRAEAKRRLAARTASRGDVTNPDAWLDRCVSNLKAEGWTPPARPRPCDTCDSTGIVLTDEGTATPCHDCKASA